MIGMVVLCIIGTILYLLIGFLSGCLYERLVKRRSDQAMEFLTFFWLGALLIAIIVSVPLGTMYILQTVIDRISLDDKIDYVRMKINGGK